METMLAPKPFSCDLCGETFSRRSSMVQHRRMHSGEKPYQCMICLKSFTRPYSLQKHLCSHTGEKAFTCDLCGRKFSRSSTLREHKRSHAGEKPFQCDTCYEYFSRRSTLHQHQRMHMGEKPHVCDVCGKRFTRRYTLQKHAVDHTGKAAYDCDVCGKRFPRPHVLRKHLRCHSGKERYTCSVCGENFSRRSNLRVHERTHSGVKPFPCTMCGKLFSRRSNLLVHERSHAGIKPYKCDLCGKRFVRNSTLTKHKEGHLSNEKCNFAEQIPVNETDITNNEIINQTTNVHSLRSTNQNVECIRQQHENYHNHLDQNTNIPANKLSEASSKHSTYNNSHNITLAPHINPTGLLTEPKHSTLCTHCGRSSFGCNHLQTLPASEKEFHLQQTPSNTPVPSKTCLSTTLTPRKWLEPPMVIVAASETQNEQLASTSCLPASGSAWQRNISSNIVSLPLCDTLDAIPSASVMEI